MDIFALLDSKNNKTQDDASTQAETKLSHNLEKFDSNHISYLNNMAKHHKDAPKANDLSMVD